MDALLPKATTHIQEILDKALLHTQETLVLYDTEAPLTRLLTEAYRRALPRARFLDIADLTKDLAMEEFLRLSPGDLVVQIQSGNFRLDDFRIRIFLYKQKLKAVEHVHLNRFPEEHWETYIDALHYDPAFYHPLGHGVRAKLLAASRAEVRSHDTVLVYDSPFEDPKLNIGDYRGMENVGGTFPLGEVFTEPKDLAKVNGQARIFAFAGLDFQVKTYDPFLVTITDGILSAGPEAPAEFHAILDLIREAEPVYVRELGLGMNPAIRPDRILADVTAFERITGLHLSLGGKHAIYPKPHIKRREGRYHIDVFVQADEITLDGEVLFKDGVYHY